MENNKHFVEKVFPEKKVKTEFLECEEKYRGFVKIDAYVDYDLQIAIESLKCGMYPVAIFFCAIALEEQLSAIYKIKTEGDKGKLYKCKGEIKKTDRMNLDCLIEWAETEGIIKYEIGGLTAIRFARNFFGHATRIMMQKTKKQFEKGEFKDILPPEREFPDWFIEMKEYHESITGDKIEPNKPVIGWLDSKETAENVCKITIDFIGSTSKLLPL